MSEQQNNYKTPPSSPRDPVCPPAPRKDMGSYGQEINEEDLEFLRTNGIEVIGQINNPVCPPAPLKDKESYGQEINEEDLEFLRRDGIEVQGQINNPGSYGDP